MMMMMIIIITIIIIIIIIVTIIYPGSLWSSCRRPVFNALKFGFVVQSKNKIWKISLILVL